VVAVAIVLATVRGAVHTGSGGAPPAGTSKLPAGPPAAQYVASGAVPRYYVSLTSGGNPNFDPSHAVVRATATGAVLGMIMASVPGGTILAVTGAADDRTFVLDEEKWVPNSSNVNASWETRSFYLVRLEASGKPGVPVKLPMTAGRLVTGVALSADATRLAIAVQPQNTRDPNLTEVKVYTLATGAVQVWHGDGTIGGSADDVESISWTADGRWLAFDWAAGNLSGNLVGTWLLDTRLSGGDLVADSRKVIATYTPTPKISTSLPKISATHPAIGIFPTLPATPPSSPPPPLRQLTCGETIAIPDGSGVVCGAIATFDDSMSKTGMYRNAETAFLEYSTTTGKVTHVLGHWTIDNVGGLVFNVLWSNPSGSVLIGAVADSGDGKVGIISGNTFTPLPGLGANDFGGVW
jgi:hypothetical protein